jgi:hypothetical protein
MITPKLTLTAVAVLVDIAWQLGDESSLLTETWNRSLRLDVHILEKPDFSNHFMITGLHTVSLVQSARSKSISISSV